MTDLTNTKYFESFERTGITQHPGGLDATRRLAQLSRTVPGQRVLDIGCGTGYTACSLAKEYGGDVVAVDLSPRILEWARQRVNEEGVGERVTLLAADARALPLSTNSFDVVLTESVLVFCNPKRAASEMHRVLKPGGRFGSNEVTVLKPLPARAREALESSGMDVSLLSEQEWRTVFANAGFVSVSSIAKPMNLLEISLLTPLRTDGVRKYVSSIFRSITDPTLRALFTNKVLRQGMRLMFGSYLGYGLYAGRKAEE